MRKNLDGGLLHAMQAFIRVVDAGSFTAAAEQMQLTTAQVSRLVTELERRLQAKLLQRTTRQRALTDAGMAYAEHCREILSLVREAEAQVSGTALQPTGRLRVRCLANFGQHYVSPRLGEFCARHPGIRVEYSTSQYAPDLLAEGLDVSLYLAPSLADSGVVMRRFGTTFTVLCASPGYLERHGTPAEPADLARHACLQLLNPSVTPHWDLVGPQGRRHRIAPQGPLQADTPEVLRDAAQQGMGITLLPLFTVIDSLRAGRLRHILPGWRSPDIHVLALLPSRHFLDAKTRAWLDFVQERIVPAMEDDMAHFL